MSKRVRFRIDKIGEWIRINRHFGVKHLFRHINNVIREYLNYYAVTKNLNE